MKEGQNYWFSSVFDRLFGGRKRREGLESVSHFRAPEQLKIQSKNRTFLIAR